MQKLKEIISTNALPLGSTAQGAEWATKALHPSDPVSPVHGAPDLEARPSTLVTFNAMVKISPPAGLSATDTWDVDILNTPDPVCFATWATDKTGNYAGSLLDRLHFTAGINNRFLNPQVSGSGATPELAYAAKVSTFHDSVESFRLAYYGATTHLDAPALSNQGTVCAVQFPYETESLSVSNYNLTGVKVEAMRSMTMIPFAQMPDYTGIQNMPNAMFGPARDGVYLPFKLSTEDLHYRNCDDLRVTHTDWDATNSTTFSAASNSLSMTTSTGLCNLLAPTADCVVTAAGATSGGRMLPRATSNLGMTSFRGLSATASVQMYVRCGFELCVLPSTVYSPFLRNPAPYDASAIQAYFAMARTLKDAYPADFNDLGKMLEFLGGVAEKVLPLAVPQLAPLIPMVKGAYRMIKGSKDPGSVSDALEKINPSLVQAKKDVIAKPKARRRLKIAPRTPAAPPVKK